MFQLEISNSYKTSSPPKFSDFPISVRRILCVFSIFFYQLTCRGIMFFLIIPWIFHNIKKIVMQKHCNFYLNFESVKVSTVLLPLKTVISMVKSHYIVIHHWIIIFCTVMFTYAFCWKQLNCTTTRRKKISKIFRKFGTYLDNMTF